MTTDERNFRSSYYEKVGCHSVEEKKSLNKLLQDNIRNHAKLKQFCLNFVVPANLRNLLWSIILGILPLHKSSTEYVWEQRTGVYEDLYRAIKKMQYIKKDGSTPKSRIFLLMWKLENNRLLYQSHTSQEDENNFVEIVKMLLQIFDDDVETYWIAKEFYQCTKEIQRECTKLIDQTQTLLKREDVILFNHLESLGIFHDADILLKQLFCRCFAGVISELSLVKVWDKICGGSRIIMVFIFLEMLKSRREAILQCSSRSDLKALIEQVKDPDAVVNKAIKNWQSNKNHNEITVH